MTPVGESVLVPYSASLAVSTVDYYADGSCPGISSQRGGLGFWYMESTGANNARYASDNGRKKVQATKDSQRGCEATRHGPVAEVKQGQPTMQQQHVM